MIALRTFLKRHTSRLVPAGAVSGVLAASFLLVPAAVTGLGIGYDYGLPACTSAKVTASPSSPQLPGTSVTLTGTATACTHPEFEFFTQAPGGPWVARTPMLTWPNNTFVWNTTNLKSGVWGIGVWARHSGATAAYEKYQLATFTLLGTNCTSGSISASPAQPQPQNTAITLTGAATGCSTPEFRFWAQSGATWISLGNYSTTTTKVWNTHGYARGPHRIGVWVRQVGSTHAYDSYAIVTFEVG
ncbi:MAG TPA: hypothetical protein VI172_06240 [Candidatus Dormibacteraeota bacterium]